MSAHGAVDPELRPLLDLLPRAPFDLATLATVRALPAMPVAPVETPGVLARQVPISVSGGAPDVVLYCYTPVAPSAPVACILHFHGGGYVAGAAARQEAAHRLLAAKLGCAIVSVDYRLAPETRFPGALDDAYAALAWVHAHAGELAVDPLRIGVMGESAGGGLAAAVTLLARDRHDYTPAFQHLHYPMLDDRTCLRDAAVRHLVWGAENNLFGWTSLLGHAPGGVDVSPYAAPARAIDLAGLPPTFLMTGGLDLFLQEDIAYASRLLAAGVPTELHVYPGAFHVFDLAPAARVAVAARRDSLDALARFTALSAPAVKVP